MCSFSFAMAAAVAVAKYGSLVDDATALLKFKDHGRNAEALESWGVGSDPCGNSTGFNSTDRGWEHVMCCGSYSVGTPFVCTGSNAERTTYLNLYNMEVEGDVATLGKVIQLEYLSLGYTDVDGDVASLAGLPNLTYLDLHMTGVHGDIAPLAQLSHLVSLRLGYTGVDGDVGLLAQLSGLTRLDLFSTRVAGHVRSLVNVPSLKVLNLDSTGVDADEESRAKLVLTCTYLSLPQWPLDRSFGLHRGHNYDL